jgi:DNA helicase-4
MNSYLNKFIKWLHWLNVTVIFHKRYRLLQEELERKQIEQKKQIEDERLIELEKEIKQEKENARLKEEDLIKRFAVISNSLSQIKKAVNNFQKHTNISNGYFNNYYKSLWVHENKILFEKIKDVPSSDLGLSPTDNLSIENLLYLYSNADSIRTSFNKKFIDQELKTYETFFDDVNGKKLNHQQRLSVITDEDNNLIVAGAGTGKTATIAGKVSYLVSRYKINPKRILLISFTRKSCEEMAVRVNRRLRIDADVKTFHALGLEIIAEAKNERPSVFEPDKVDPSLMFRGFIDIHAKNHQYLKNLNDFLLFYLKPYKCEEDFKNKKEEMQYLKDHHIRGFKIVKEFNNGVFLYEHRQIKNFLPIKIKTYSFFSLACSNIYSFTYTE